MSQRNRSRGFFITFEGPEGSGKSTQARWLVQWLRQQGFRVTPLRDPGSTSLGRALRKVLLHTTSAMSPLQEALLFIGGRVALVEERIAPALADGRAVVCDRFHDSTVAYQGFGGSLDVAWLDRIGRRAIGELMPQLTILLDVPTSVGFARLRRSPDRMERKTMAFHQRLRRGYLQLAKRDPNRIVVLDATQPASTIRQHIKRIVQQRLS